jgi:type I restriction enzyme R subunit
MSGETWDEEHLAELPAQALLELLGYTFVPAEVLFADREERLADAVLTRRAVAAVKRLNPWITDENASKAVRQVSHVQAPGLIEANEQAHTALVYGVTVEQDLGDGKRGQPVRLIDFAEVERNEFLVTRQFRVKAQRDVVADLVVFVNGFPLGIIEFKSPTAKDPAAKAVAQLLRYQELSDDHRGLGAPRLFHAAQMLVAAWGGGAVYGTVGTPQRHWAEWKVPHPLTIDRVEALYGEKARGQEVLLAGIFQKANLLDLVRNFVVFEVENGRTVKKVARYQQFVAVDLAMRRIVDNAGPDRGGVVWHTQGSGKSLTMVFLAVKLRRLRAAENPTIVVVTDRRDLDIQISETFRRCGFPDPIRAESVEHLRALLSGPTGRTVMTTVQKFQESSGGQHPVLNTASNVFVMVDEAHRTQYRALAGNMRRALPNACFLGFTGTPIDKKDRSVLRTFGPYIHRYTIEQAVADGATVPIFYEMRDSRDRVEGEPLDRIFDRVFRDRTKEEQDAIKARYGTVEAIASAPQRIARICEDLVEHFEKHIRPGGFKAQVVACTREAAVLYKETLDRLGAPDSAVIISGSQGDTDRLARWTRSPNEQKRLIDDFKKRDHPLSILIVCDMLLTGFDAPIEQVMYLDAPLREHTLLQAIARVNRTAEGKGYGLVVDYWGVADHLEEALAIFAKEDVEGALRPRADEFPRLQVRHRAVMRYFEGVDRNDAEACLRVVEPEDVRAEFEAAFRRFGQSLDVLLPEPPALGYLPDLKWLAKLREMARNRFRDDELDLSGCREKVRKLIEDYVRSDGVDQILKPVSILAPEFEEEIAKLGSDDAKASEMEHAIRHEINVRVGTNPAFYESLSARLKKIIEDRRAKRIDAAEQLRLLQGVMQEMRAVRQSAEAIGLDEDGFALYELLGRAAGAKEDDGPDAGRRDAAREVLAAIRPLAVVDWTRKEDVQRRMRQEIKTLLQARGWPRDAVQPLAGQILDLARRRLGA